MFTAVFVDRVIRNLNDLHALGGVEGSHGFAGLPLTSYLIPTSKYAWRLRRTVSCLGRGGSVVVHAHDVMSAFLARRLFWSVPQILTMHSIGSWVTQGFLLHRPQLKGSIVEKLLRHVETSAVEKAEVVAFTSRSAVELFEADCPGILRKKDVRIIHTGIDVDEIAAFPADRGSLRRYGVEGKRLLLSVSPHVPEKGLNILIEAIAALPSVVRNGVRVLLVGRGPSTKELISLINERGLRDTVRVLEWVPDVISLMKLADVFVLAPLKTVFDLVFLEAMGARTPVITTAVGGNLELFDDGSAILVPPANPSALREAIIRVLDDQVLRASLAANAYQRVLRDFTLSRMLQEYLLLYEEATRNRSAPSGIFLRSRTH